MGRTVAILHPDLGVGGAERLIVDASEALQACGHNVVIFTGYHNKSRCFEETVDGTLQVITIGQWIPRSFAGRFHALMAYIKMMYIAIYVALSMKSLDLILCDQVAACIPIFKLTNLLSRFNSKIVFYCHFPDKLLTARNNIVKRIYRFPIDKLEEWSTGLADIIVVNSEFTKRVVKETFKSLENRQMTVLYPCVNVRRLQDRKPSPEECNTFKMSHDISNSDFILLSLNRYERKKELETAIVQFQLMIEESHDIGRSSYHLIIAGGYDHRLEDCVSYYKELVNLTIGNGLQKRITFLKSPSDNDKIILLHICDALVYTPQNEHFGIVPIEAMAMRRPVIACASGGPLETIEHGENGYLCSPSEMHRYMIKLASQPQMRKRMGDLGYQRSVERFSYEIFRDKLDLICFDAHH